MTFGRQLVHATVANTAYQGFAYIGARFQVGNGRLSEFLPAGASDGPQHSRALQL
jgi:hypothetical protein